MTGFDRSRMTRRQLLRAVPAAALALGIGAAWPARCNGRLYPGATVLGMDLGGLSRPEAIARLRDQLADFEGRAVTFWWRDRRWGAAASDLGITVDYDATVGTAWRHGRDGGLVNRYSTLIERGGRRTTVSPVLTLDDAVMTAFFGTIDDEIARAPRDAQLRLDGSEMVVRPEREGARLKIEAAKRDTLAAVRSLTPTTVELRRRSVVPAVSGASLEALRADGARLLSDVVTVHSGDAAWTVSVDELAAALILPAPGTEERIRLDSATLTDALSPIALDVDTAPRNATLAWDGGLYVMEAGSDGIAVDLEQLAVDVATAAATEEREVTLPLIFTAPVIGGTDLDALGITTRLARGESSFAGSSSARATNVSVSAYFVSQTLVPPGGTFSFNEAIGAITVDKGYVEGKIISGDWYASDLGGGVCQVSTTVFRAALLAGLEFPEWHPHSFRLGFYELDGWPPGIDAAIFQPDTADGWALDLRFANPTDAWMLVQADVVGETLRVDLFGPDTNYEVEISDPAFGETLSVPETIERPSADLATGVREQEQAAQMGVEVTVTRLVSVDGEIVDEETFISLYAPQAEVWSVGTGEET